MTSPPDPLPEICQRRAAITAAPWRTDNIVVAQANGQAVARLMMVRGSFQVAVRNAEFIAAAPTDIDWLVGEVIDRRREVDQLRNVTTEVHAILEGVLQIGMMADDVRRSLKFAAERLRRTAAAIRSTSGEEQP